MSRRCLCEICTCGRHHCPHGTTRIYKTSGVSCPTTEYLEKYPTYGNVLPPQSLKPKQELQACRARMEGVTTFKSDYHPYEIVKQPRHVPEEYKPKQGEIDLGTTYKRDFNSYKVQPVAIVRPLERQQVKKGKLDTVPTYKDNRDSFRMPEDRVRKWKAASQNPNQFLRTQPRSRLSSAKAAFLASRLGERAGPGVRLPWVRRRPSLEVEGVCAKVGRWEEESGSEGRKNESEGIKATSYSTSVQISKGNGRTFGNETNDYRAWDILKSELCKPEQSYHPPTVKFGNSTTFQDDYVPQEIKPRQSFKPGSNVKPSAAPFHGDTSHRLDYIPHQPEVKFARPKKVYKPPSQPFEDLTTHRYDFQGLVGETAKICRPADTRVTQNAQFEGSTEFRASFQPWEIPPPKVKKVQEYVPPAGAMPSHSTSHLDYVPHQAKRVAPIRPASHRRNNHFPFQGKSTMKEDFPAWESCRQGLIKNQQIPNPSGKFDGLSTFRSHYVPHELIPAESCKPLNVPFKSSIPLGDGTMDPTEHAPEKQEICPASYPSPPGYIFENTDSRGHKFFRKIAPRVEAF